MLRMLVELTETLLREAAGWDVMKLARAYHAQGQVLSSHWAPPLLRGVVQAGETSFRASMVINSAIDIENLCTCRDAREWGKICAHGVAVGLHWLEEQKTAASPTSTRPPARSSTLSSSARKSSSLRRDPSGEPAELFIILPPNIDQGIARDKIMLVFEAKWSGGRSPLNVLPKEQAFAFSEADGVLLEEIEKMTNGETPAIMQLTTKEFTAWLPNLVDHPNITLGKGAMVTVTRNPLRLSLRASLESNGEITVSLKQEKVRRVRLGDWVWQNNTLQPLDLPPLISKVLDGPIRVPRPQVPQFLSQHWPTLVAEGNSEADFKLEDFTLEPKAPQFLLELRGGLTQVTALLQCVYGSRIMTVGLTATDESIWLPDPGTPTRYSTRDVDAERAALARLQRCGFSGAAGKLQLAGQNAVLNFFAREFPSLQREWKVTLEEKLDRSTTQNLDRIEPQFRISSGVQWFDLGVVFTSKAGETFSPAEIQRLLLSGQSYTRLKSGKLALLDTGAVEELTEMLRDCNPQQHEQGYRINNAQAGFLEATLREHANWRVQVSSDWRACARKQSGEAKLECPPLGDLEKVLRPYQKHGVAWLQFLCENNFGGILADEMGLGKTLQTLALLRSGRLIGQAILPDLVVCPTSLVFNWVCEAKKFTPELKVLALHGPERHALFEQIQTHDLIITSYALIRRDAERYRGLEFDRVVLDEAQHIKNRQTQNAQSVKSMKARHRFVLTGTPLENSVLDLWSIFDFLMPGYLGTSQDFRERYEIPIIRDKNEKAQTRLARRLKPFMLRRLKKEVEPELPEKLEQVCFCDLTSEQRTVYQQMIEASRKEILEAAGAQGEARSRIVVLTALLRLRQVCCDLRLLKPEGVDPANASGKLDVFSELLEEVIDGGHRLLVFSQFVSMLTLLKQNLNGKGIDYCYLDGSTSDRQGVVERFKTNSAIPVFLISLKAGGVGLNLTEADAVIHFDPWWNPAVEDQASARAHRIGQTKVVTSYKLIARDTVEEKILSLQNRKREVIEATIGGEEELAASLRWEEIQELLA